ncbi:MAG: MarR family transcriptional regulator [Planctomycetota bacterium]|jgi:DNA-binding transcriptional regulator LsrR (DeoR family)|nr:MarR family transcriptional regulator [Planctomycetota bacterium]
MENANLSRREKKLSRLSEIAVLYYNHNLTQEQIAKRLFISRTSISRMLREAREAGIVEIKINIANERCRQLEQVFRRKLDIEDAFIFNANNAAGTVIKDLLCRNAAQCINSMLSPGMTLGVTRGVTVAGMMEYLSENPPKNLDLKIVQLMGEVTDADPNVSSGDIIRSLLKVFGGKAYYLNAPMYVENDSIRNDLLREPIIRSTIKIGEKADLIITGIGSLDRGKGLRDSIISKVADANTITSLIAGGGVGNIFGHVFNITGKLVAHPLNNRIISAGFDALSKIKTLAVSYGSERGEAVLGAIRSKHVSILFTDRLCAERVIALADNQH